jgi:hypothetical protein
VVGMAVLVVLQVRLSCLLRGVEAAEVVVVAGCCGACSRVLALVWIHTLEDALAPVRPHEPLSLKHLLRALAFRTIGRRSVIGGGDGGTRARARLAGAEASQRSLYHVSLQRALSVTKSGAREQGRHGIFSFCLIWEFNT